MLQDNSCWDLFDAVAAKVGDRACIISPTEVRSYREVHERAERIAGFLHARGMGANRSRDTLCGWESGQDHLALYLGNGSPYVETMLGALRSRVVPVNVNYHYVASELAQLLEVSACTGIVYDADLAPVLAEVVPALPTMKVLIQVGGTNLVIPGSVAFDEVAGSCIDDPGPLPEPSDLCIICTGGTTGLPKAVLWRQDDLIWSTIGDRHGFTGARIGSLADIGEVAQNAGLRTLIGPPLMHFAGFGIALFMVMTGGTIVFASPPRGMDAAAIWQTVEREAVNVLMMVGDAFGRPLLDELRSGTYDTTSLSLIMSGAARLSLDVKRGLTEMLGPVLLSEGVGSSESGVLGRALGADQGQAGVFVAGKHTGIVDENKERFLGRDDDSSGWLAGFGPVPLGYLGDEAKTAATFFDIDGRRCTVAGDRARWLPDGSIELLGRDSTTINTGGEKVFSDEVERALMHHDVVREAIVVGRPSARWGEEVVGIVVAEGDQQIDVDDVLTECGRHVARYKLPKQLIVVDALRRSPIGKPDYAWAKTIAADALNTPVT
jgi:acyl-CoA synthetase (AMP-forming)/AMP-acid ligase II